MKIQKLHLRVSELSSIVGYNPYADIKPIILRLWQKADQKDYFETVIHLVNKNVIENPLIRPEDIVQSYCRKYKTNFLAGMELCKKANNTEELHQHKTHMLNKVESNTQINANDKLKLKDSLDSLAKTNYGIQHEDFAIEYYCQQYNIKINEQQKYIKKKIAFSNSIEWYLTGKIDGIRDDNILIEVKNRVNKLFGVLKPYENIQLQVYLHLFNLKKSHLVESIKINNNRQIHVIEVDYDKHKWNEIKAKITIFLDFFYQFLKSDDLKHLFLTKSNIELNHYYKSIIEAKI